MGKNLRRIQGLAARNRLADPLYCFCNSAIPQAQACRFSPCFVGLYCRGYLQACANRNSPDHSLDQSYRAEYERVSWEQSRRLSSAWPNACFHRCCQMCSSLQKLLPYPKKRTSNRTSSGRPFRFIGHSSIRHSLEKTDPCKFPIFLPQSAPYGSKIAA
jgi:hypothetical protein